VVVGELGVVVALLVVVLLEVVLGEGVPLDVVALPVPPPPPGPPPPEAPPPPPPGPAPPPPPGPPPPPPGAPPPPAAPPPPPSEDEAEVEVEVGVVDVAVRASVLVACDPDAVGEGVSEDGPPQAGRHSTAATITAPTEHGRTMRTPLRGESAVHRA
jgi:hypothetical protein